MYAGEAERLKAWHGAHGPHGAYGPHGAHGACSAFCAHCAHGVHGGHGANWVLDAGSCIWAYGAHGAHGATGPQVCNTSCKCATSGECMRHQSQVGSKTLCHACMWQIRVQVLAALNPVDPLHNCDV